MEWLNYHHLLYFWVVAREGSVTRAAAELRLGQPTVSAQIRTLEATLGEKLFIRVGRNLALADAPLAPTVRIRAFNHLLGECGLTFFGTSRLARAYRRGFPRSLAGAPLLLPTDNTALRRSLEQWFDAEGIRPLVTGEFEDSALLNVFGR